jgi:hypothetical protein
LLPCKAMWFAEKRGFTLGCFLSDTSLKNQGALSSLIIFIIRLYLSSNVLVITLLLLSGLYEVR